MQLLKNMDKSLVFPIVTLFLIQLSWAYVSRADCPSKNFLDLSRFQQTDINQARASVRAYCEGDYLVVESNGMPTYKAVRMTPNRISTQHLRWKIPLNPRIADEPSEVPYLGPIAVTVTGLPIFAPNEAKDLGYGDAKLDGILDKCGGHVGPRGIYHFHARPDCPFRSAKDLASAVIGYAFDGFPIMEPYVCVDQECTDLRKIQGSWHECVDNECSMVKLRKLDSSWELVRPTERAAWEKFAYVEGSGDLDKCNGMFGSDGKYRYYATETFPYNLGCYRGIVDRSLNDLRPGWSHRGSFNEPVLPPHLNRGEFEGFGPNSPRREFRGGPHPDLGIAAERLGIPEQELRDALGPPPPNLHQAARKLGIGVQELRDALELSIHKNGDRRTKNSE